MKAMIKNFILFIVLISVTWIAPQKASAQVSVDFQVFYDDLSPYGTWIDNPDYGYVWVPDVPSGFSPYSTNGYWIYTDAGWTWVSNYSWGWAPFHYGRWYSDPVYGSVWVPGNEWGPGWVTWRRTEDYYGWAPIGPGISIDIAYSSGYSLPNNSWRFVRNRDFGRTNITNYYINNSRNTTIIHQSTVINNIHPDRSNNVIKYNGGPDRNDVQKHAGRTFNPVVLRERSKPGQNLGKGELQIYRPPLQKNTIGGNKPAPAKVAVWKDMKQRNTPSSQNENQPTKQQGNSQPVKQPTVQQPRRNDQPDKQPPSQPQRNDQPVKQQPPPPQRNDRPTKQPVQPQRNDQPVKQQPPARQRNDQPAKQPAQPQRNDQPAKPRPQHNDQPTKQPQTQPKRNDQPPKQQSTQPQRTTPPQRQQPPQPQRNNQPSKQPVPQQKHNDQPGKQQSSMPERNSEPKKRSTRSTMIAGINSSDKNYQLFNT